MEGALPEAAANTAMETAREKEAPPRLWHLKTTDQKIDAVRAAIADKVIGATAIAEACGAPSRNAVIGICHRHGIALDGRNWRGRTERMKHLRAARASEDAAADDMADDASAHDASSALRAPPPPRNRRPRTAGFNDIAFAARKERKPRADAAKPADVAPLGDGIPFLERRSRQCGFIVAGEKATARVCGRPIDPLSGTLPSDPPYCDAHRDVAFGLPLGTSADQRGASSPSHPVLRSAAERRLEGAGDGPFVREDKQRERSGGGRADGRDHEPVVSAADQADSPRPVIAIADRKAAYEDRRRVPGFYDGNGRVFHRKVRG